MPRHAAARGPLACAAVLLLAAPAALAVPPDQGGVVYLKDGHVLKGYVLQPSETVIDPYSKESVVVHQGIFLMDDLCRRFFFSHAYVDRADPRAFDFGKGNMVLWKLSSSFPQSLSLPPILEETLVDEWNDKWDRRYQFNSPAGEIKLAQHLSVLSPHYARADAHCINPFTKANNPYPWTSYYRTAELGPEQVVRLLSMRDELKDRPSLPEAQRADRRFQIFNFLVQAGWIGAAEEELKRIKRDFPGQKEKIETAAEGIKKLVAQDRLDEIKRAQAAGRHEAAQKLLAKFPDGADDQTQAEVRTLKVRYDAAGTALKRTTELLAELAKEVGAGDDARLFAEASAAIAAELNLDHFFKKENEEGRLERFLTQAEQAERFAKQKLPHPRPGELLSFAVTGWLLGPGSAEKNPEAARRAWQARRFVREYQKAAAGDRAALLKDYEGKSGPGAAEMAQLIARLPPLDPPAKTTSDEVEMKAGGGGKGMTYRLKLPPEYHVGRPYPVLIALHQGRESGKDMVKRWGEEAARYGYILACPDWDARGAGVYTYTSAEHDAVLDTLRDLREHFNVDSDRVFLTGYGEGANMAWDVGVSHPDLFAGVAPVCANPRYHALAYWPNSMELPFYVVWGERMGPGVGKNDNANVVIFNLFKDHWIPRGAPALGVQYKGRGLTWFPAEVPDVFEWMAQKRRHNPLKVGFREVVGKDSDVTEYRDDLRILRAGDNHFYWVSVDDIVASRLREGPWTAVGTPATVAAKIVTGNQIGVFAGGVKKVTLWLGRGTIDFDKPVTVRLNFGIKLNGVTVKPSLATLLDDFCERGDRQRLFLARIDLK